jgi:hypothetical protein
MTAVPVSAESGSVPSLFYNDSAFPLDDIMPLKIVDGVYYIPREFIKKIEGIYMETRDNYSEDFYISYGNKSISFKVSAEIADMDCKGEYVHCKVIVDGWLTYVPAQFVAKHLGLEVEIRHQYPTLRLKNKNAKANFDDMINARLKPLFVPPTEPPITSPLPPPPTTTAPPVETTTVPPVITSPPPIIDEITTTENKDNTPFVIKPTPPPTTTEPTTPENTRELENYLMFYDGYTADELLDEKTENINEVLKILDKNNMRAVFFLSGSEIIENPDIMRKIYASGYELGIKFECGKVNINAEDLIAELESANNLIYSALKHKTRFCMFDEIIDENIDDEDDEPYEEKLRGNGYYLCKKTSDILDLNDIKNSNEMIEYMKQNTLNVFMFDLNGGYKNYMQLFAQADEIKFYIKFSYINNANISKIKDRINSQEQTTE